jgi:hypothetical protein
MPSSTSTRYLTRTLPKTAHVAATRRDAERTGAVHGHSVVDRSGRTGSRRVGPAFTVFSNVLLGFGAGLRLARGEADDTGDGAGGLDSGGWADGSAGELANGPGSARPARPFRHRQPS